MGLLELLPFSIDEIKPGLEDLNHQLFKGFYPSIYDRKVRPNLWYEDYLKTYLERDVRKLINVKDLNAFRRFLKLCAARNAQIINWSELCLNSGLNRKTLQSWVSTLEASFILYLVHPYFKNTSKRLIKSPKLYFYDSGLVCYLLGLSSPQDVFLSSFRGNLFESMVMSEIKKYNMNYRKGRDIYFWKDRRGLEIDLIFEKNETIYATEIKAGQTFQPAFFKNLKPYQKQKHLLHKKSFVIYGGKDYQKRQIADLIPWDNITPLLLEL